MGFALIARSTKSVVMRLYKVPESVGDSPWVDARKHVYEN